MIDCIEKIRQAGFDVDATRFVFLKGFFGKNKKICQSGIIKKQASFSGGYPLAFWGLLGKIKKFGEWVL